MAPAFQKIDANTVINHTDKYDVIVNLIATGQGYGQLQYIIKTADTQKGVSLEWNLEGEVLTYVIPTEKHVWDTGVRLRENECEDIKGDLDEAAQALGLARAMPDMRSIDRLIKSKQDM